EVPDLPQTTFLKATPSHLPLITGLPGVCVPDASGPPTPGSSSSVPAPARVPAGYPSARSA
ncbi:hypothetical protein, partial [Streptomyces anthocyanicus]